MRDLLRLGLMILGSFLIVAAGGLWVAPFVYQADAFFRLFWWVRDYPATTMLVGFLAGVGGFILFVVAVEMGDEPTTIPPPWRPSRE